jgi:uncharacterized protein (TIGR00251 family)
MAPPLRLALKVIPGSSREGLAGWLGDSLKVRVRVPAERGKANAAVTTLLARALGVPVDAVRIVSGATSQRKTVEIDDVEEVELAGRTLRRQVEPAGRTLRR